MLGFVTKNGFLKKNTKGGPFGSAGGRIPEGLYVPGFQTEVIEHGKFVSKRSKKLKEQKKNKKERLCCGIRLNFPKKQKKCWPRFEQFIERSGRQPN